MSVDESLLCSFQVCSAYCVQSEAAVVLTIYLQILKPAEKKQKYVHGGLGGSNFATPRKQSKS